MAHWRRLPACPIVVILALALAGCSSPQVPPGPERPSEQETVEVRVRNEGAEFPSGCSPQDVLKILSGFVTAFNAGDHERLKGYFGEGFHWFSVTMGPDDHVAIHDIAGLQPYFEARHKQAEKLTLQKLEVAPDIGRVGFTFNIQRTADDLQQGTVNVGGKGMVRCDTKTIAAWSMGNVPVVK